MTANRPTHTGLVGPGNTRGFGQQIATGTAYARYYPIIGTDVVDTRGKSRTIIVAMQGKSRTINVLHHCITCMKEYANKSLEELRLEDYTAGRKGNANVGVFSFSQPQENKSVFEGSRFNTVTASTSLFGAPVIASTSSFGAPVTASTSSFGLFGAPVTASTSSFGSFGAPVTASTSSFGAPVTASTSSFGAPVTASTSSFGLFGAPVTASTSSFGSFGAPVTASTSLFGAPVTTSTSSFGLFGAPVTFGSRNNGGSDKQQIATGTAHAQYNPVVGTDVDMSGKTINVGSCKVCGTEFKSREYDHKCLEKLRLEDYTAGRKSNANVGVFSFGQPQENKSVFEGSTPVTSYNYRAQNSPPPQRFHSYHSPNVTISPDGTIAQCLKPSLCCPFVFSARPVQFEEKPIQSDTQSSDQRTRSEVQRSDCRICLEKPIDSTLYPCGHICMCRDCAVDQWQGRGNGLCPICRKEIIDVIYVYMS